MMGMMGIMQSIRSEANEYFYRICPLAVFGLIEIWSGFLLHTNDHLATAHPACQTEQGFKLKIPV